MKLRIPKKIAVLGCMTAMAWSGWAQTASPLDKLPLYFEANQGQSATNSSFLAHTADAQCAISANGVEMNLRRASGSASLLQMKFVGVNPAAEIHGDAELSGKVNYLIGNDPAQWHAGVPTFGQVRLDKIYAGVDVVFYGNQRQLEYDFNFAAGANPDVVALRFEGADKIQVNKQGDLVIALGSGEICQPQPMIYQVVNGTRRSIRGGYKILANQTVGFRVGNYDRSLPLVIDPVLSYSTFLGGNYGDTALSVVVDSSGNNIYVAGKTFSTTFSNGIPWSTTNAFQTNFHGGSLTGDAFVAKLNNNGSNLVYLTYLGGNSDDGADGIAVDAQGNAYIGGFTSSTNFPIFNINPGSGISTNISGKILSGFGYLTDAFVTELNTNGSQLIYSGLLGGSESDAVMSIAVDPLSGTAYLTGYTYSTNFPVTSDAISKKLGCPYSLYYNANAFVAEIAPGGSNLNYSTYLGGTNFDTGTSIAFNNGSVFVAGYTRSTNFPTLNYIRQIVSTNYSGTNIVSTNIFDGHYLNRSNYLILYNDAFVAAFTNTSASSTTNLTLLYSTLLGSTNDDLAFGIAADASGNAYVVGSTTSSNFPSLNTIGTNLLSSYVQTNSIYLPATNAFISQITWDGTRAHIGYSAIFGGAGDDIATAVALDPSGTYAFVTGYATSTNFPVTKASIFGSLRATNSGGSDAFVIAFNNNGSALLYSTYLGGLYNDYGYGIAVDASDSAYVVGQTLSTNFPNFNARQKNMNGTNDAFLAKITLASPTLQASMSGTNFLVSVPPVGDLSSNNFSLETTTNLLVSTNWVVITNFPTLVNGTNVFKFNPTNHVRFFRFHK